MILFKKKHTHKSIVFKRETAWKSDGARWRVCGREQRKADNTKVEDA